MDDVEVKRSGSRTPLIVAACALMFGLFIGLGIGVAIGIGTCEAAAKARRAKLFAPWF